MPDTHFAKGASALYLREFYVEYSADYLTKCPMVLAAAEMVQ